MTTKYEDLIKSLTLYGVAITLGVLLRTTSLHSINYVVSYSIANYLGSVRVVANAISLTASVISVWIIAGGLIIYTYISGNKASQGTIITLLTTLLLNELLTAILKVAFGIVRPNAETPTTWGIRAVSIYSYPSGHSSRATILAYWLIRIISSSKYFKAALWSWVVLVMISRVIVLDHYVADVVGGFLVGIATTYLLKPLHGRIVRRLSIQPY